MDATTTASTGAAATGAPLSSAYPQGHPSPGGTWQLPPDGTPDGTVFQGQNGRFYVAGDTTHSSRVEPDQIQEFYQQMQAGSQPQQPSPASLGAGVPNTALSGGGVMSADGGPVDNPNPGPAAAAPATAAATDTTGGAGWAQMTGMGGGAAGAAAAAKTNPLQQRSSMSALSGLTY